MEASLEEKLRGDKNINQWFLPSRLPAVLGPLQITLGDVYTELKNLVKTFR